MKILILLFCMMFLISCETITKEQPTQNQACVTTLINTTNEFNLTSCALAIQGSYLHINMSYLVIDDRKGAVADRVYFAVYYLNNMTFNDPVKTTGPNHKQGQTIKVAESLYLSKDHFPARGDYYIRVSLCHYYCENWPMFCDCPAKHQVNMNFKFADNLEFTFAQDVNGEEKMQQE